jgi:hypothetical protein
VAVRLFADLHFRQVKECEGSIHFSPYTALPQKVFVGMGILEVVSSF